MIDKISYTRTHALDYNPLATRCTTCSGRCGGRTVISQLIVENKFFIVPLIILLVYCLCMSVKCNKRAAFLCDVFMFELCCVPYG